MFGQCLAGNETFLAHRTLIAKIARMVLHVLTQLDGRRKGFVTVLTLVGTFFIVHKFYVLLQLVRFGVAFLAKHTNVRPNAGVHAPIMLLQMRFSCV